MRRSLGNLAARSLVSACLLLSISQGARGDSARAQELLNQVASTYKAIKNYVVVINHQRRGGAAPVLGVTPQPNAHIADNEGPATVIPFDPMMLIESRIVLARSGRAVHYQVGAPGSKPAMLWIDSGDITWQYRPKIKKYTEQPAAEWPQRPGPGPGLPGLEWKYFTKFRAIGGMANHATLLKEDVAPDDTCPSAFSVVELKIGTAIVEDLHIMTKSSLVCQSIVRRHFIGGGGHLEYFTDTTSWKFLKTSDPIDPSLFIFHPPKHVKKVTHFK